MDLIPKIKLKCTETDYCAFFECVHIVCKGTEIGTNLRRNINVD